MGPADAQPGPRPRLACAIALLWWIATTIGAVAASAAPTIDVRVSVKIIRNPADGSRPLVAGSGGALTNADITTMIADANTHLLEAYWRGYRFFLTEIVDVGSPCASCTISNPSFWYDTLFSGPSMEPFENRAKIDADYVWRTNAINVYITGYGNGGISSFPDIPGSDDLTVMGAQCFRDPGFDPRFASGTFTHELGHYFNLGHTNGIACDAACTIGGDCTSLSPTDGDGISDTILDGQCSSKNDLAQFNFSMPYSSLPLDKKQMVDDVYDDLMAYIHWDTQVYGYFLSRMTEGQLDKWTDTANDVRTGVRSGRTWFVAETGSVSGPGTSTTPYRLPSQAVTAASAGIDIVVLRPGVYLESPLWNKAVTLRATRKGSAIIGNPALVAAP